MYLNVSNKAEEIFFKTQAFNNDNNNNNNNNNKLW